MADFHEVVEYYYGIPVERKRRRVFYVHSALSKLGLSDVEVDSDLAALSQATEYASGVEVREQVIQQLSKLRIGQEGLRRLSVSQFNLHDFFKQTPSVIEQYAHRMSTGRKLFKAAFGSLPVSHQPVEAVLPKFILHKPLADELETIADTVRKIASSSRPGDPAAQNRAYAVIKGIGLAPSLVARLGMSELAPDTALELLASGEEEHMMDLAEIVISSRYIARSLDFVS